MKYVLNQFESKKDEKLAKSAFREGIKLYGYCCGYFGRDSFSTKTITAIHHNDYIEVINKEGYSESCYVRSWVNLLEASNSWLEDHKEEIENEER